MRMVPKLKSGKDENEIEKDKRKQQQEEEKPVKEWNLE